MTTHRRQHHRDQAARHDNGGSWATCGPCGKRAFHSKTAARNALRDVRRNNDRKGLEPVTPGRVLRVYRCPETGSYHLGHLPTRARKRANLNDPRLKWAPEVAT